MVDQVELKPCPFCDAEMEIIPLLRDKDKPEAERECVAKHPGDLDDETCLLSGCGLHPNKWAAWNTRTAYNPNERLREGEDNAKVLLDTYDAARRKLEYSNPKWAAHAATYAAMVKARDAIYEALARTSPSGLRE